MAQTRTRNQELVRILDAETEARLRLERAEAAMFSWLDAHCPRVRERFDREAMHALRRDVVAASSCVSEPHHPNRS